LVAPKGAGVSFCSILLEAGRDFCVPRPEVSDVSAFCGCSSFEETDLCMAPVVAFILALDLSPLMLACQPTCGNAELLLLFDLPCSPPPSPIPTSQSPPPLSLF